jgi:hypothetical protein
MLATRRGRYAAPREPCDRGTLSSAGPETSTLKNALISAPRRPDDHTSGVPPFTPSGMTTVLASRATEALRDRRRSQASDDVFAYAAAKIYQGWRFGLPQVRCSLADHLRLAVAQDDIDRVALAGMVIYCAGASYEQTMTPISAPGRRPKPSTCGRRRARRLMSTN